MSIFLSFLKYYHGSPSDSNNHRICCMFQAAAHDTWERIAFSRTRPRMKIHETSVTQNLVYEMNKIKWEFGIPGFSIFESTNEAAHGDDLEICVVQHGGLVYKYALQAKIIYHSIRQNKRIRLDEGKYEQFDHVTAGQNQVDLLLAYARSNGCIPLYLLYNYVAGTAMNGNYCGVSFDKMQYGCSLVTAAHLKSNHSDTTGNLKGNVRFSNLHPNPAVPWFLFACCFPGFQLPAIISTLRLPGDFTVPSFSVDRIETDNPRWNLLGPITETATNLNNNFKEPQVAFLPKYRLLINTSDAEN